MEKGAIHLDWMISMSIFLVFLLLILVYFKPGSEPAYQKSYLIPIIENNFKKEVYYSIERLPISADIDVSNLDYDIQYLEFEFNGNFPICGSIDDFQVVNASLPFTPLNFYIKSLDCNTKTGIMDIEPLHISKDTTNSIRFYLLYSEGLNYKASNPGLNCMTTSVPPNDPNCIKALDLKIGVSEIITGLNKNKLDRDYDLDGNFDGGLLANISTNYNKKLKKSWGYPPSKDFKICVDRLDDANCYPNNTIKSIPEDANVFAKEFKENILNDNTELGGSIAVNIRTW